MLRAVPDKLLGVVFMGSAVLFPFFLPWLDRCNVKSIRYRSWIYKVALAVFAISFLTLGYLGLQRPTQPVVVLCRIFTILYFAFFLSLPFYSRSEKTKPVPTRVTM
jgi:ubiquinol-cytochrome c reductase cytochrome b subunit